MEEYVKYQLLLDSDDPFSYDNNTVVLFQNWSDGQLINGSFCSCKICAFVGKMWNCCFRYCWVLMTSGWVILDCRGVRWSKGCIWCWCSPYRRWVRWSRIQRPFDGICALARVFSATNAETTKGRIIFMVNRLKRGLAKHEQCLMTYRGLQPFYGTTQNSSIQNGFNCFRGWRLGRLLYNFGGRMLSRDGMWWC